jgi:hypothetical protein
VASRAAFFKPTRGRPRTASFAVALSPPATEAQLSGTQSPVPVQNTSVTDIVLQGSYSIEGPSSTTVLDSGFQLSNSTKPSQDDTSGIRGSPSPAPETPALTHVSPTPPVSAPVLNPQASPAAAAAAPAPTTSNSTTAHPTLPSEAPTDEYKYVEFFDSADSASEDQRDHDTASRDQHVDHASNTAATNSSTQQVSRSVIPTEQQHTSTLYASDCEDGALQSTGQVTTDEHNASNANHTSLSVIPPTKRKGRYVTHTTASTPGLAHACLHGCSNSCTCLPHVVEPF